MVYRTEQRTSFSQVVSDFIYRVGDGVHILGPGVAKSPKVFNHFIGVLTVREVGACKEDDR